MPQSLRRQGRAAYRRLSESPLWTAQRRYFERAGIDAWRTATVPHHVTNNVALATMYARVVLGFLRDAARAAPSEPLYVIELGAGPGRFAFQFLRALEGLPHPIRYVMTDVPEATIDFWRHHEALAPFVRAGRLDFARFDVERGGVVRLERERRVLAPATPAARVVVIANYVFGSLRHDAFAVRAGRMHETLAAVTWPSRGRRNAADVALAWRVGARATARYPEDDFNAILGDYAKTARTGHMVFPVAALRCLDRLAALAREDLLVLVADRGTTDAADAVTRGVDLDLARHGAVSLPVNFHAIRAWVTRRGGASLRPPHAPQHVHIAGFMLGANAGGWRETRRAYDDAVADGGPDALYGLRRGLATASPSGLVSLMRLCGDDPRVVAECIRPLWPHLADADATLRRDIREAVLAAWPNYYHIGEAYDLAFNLGLLLYAVRAYAEARTLFEASVRLSGDDAATRWNLGLCEVALGKPDEAVASFQRARILAPDLHPAGPAVVKSGFIY